MITVFVKPWIGARTATSDIYLVKTTSMEMGVPASLFPDPHHERLEIHVPSEALNV